MAAICFQGHPYIWRTVPYVEMALTGTRAMCDLELGQVVCDTEQGQVVCDTEQGQVVCDTEQGRVDCRYEM